MSILHDIEKIENNYDIKSLQFNNTQLWPYVRLYMSYSILGKNKVKAEKKVVLKAVKNLFYGFFNLFRKVDYLFFSNTEQRKLINDKYYDRFDLLSKKYQKSLFFELTTESFKKRREIPTKNITSKIPLYFLAKIIKLFVSVKKIKNIQIVNRIIIDNNFKIDLVGLLKDYLSHYYVAKLLIRIYKPKALILITSYTNYPYIHAFKEKGLNVIEFQHGLITQNHLAYNYSVKFDKKIFPNYIFTFGEVEKQIFNEKNYFINKNNVIPVGHFYIDYLRKNKKNNDNFKQKISKFKLSIAVSLQGIYNNKMISYIEKLAKLYTDIAFVLIPRENINYKSLNNNIFINENMNCYDVILNTDIHCTIYSTCAIEALGLNKINILINIDKKSEEHLNFLIKNNDNSFLVNTEKDFEDIINLFEENKFTDISNKYFVSNYTDNVNKELNKILV